MKVLFYHNTASEYRIPLFQEISGKLDIIFVFTRMSLAKKIYGNDADDAKLQRIRHIILSNGFKAFCEIWSQISNKEVQCVVIPTLDSFIETLLAYWIFAVSVIKNKKIFYFWGKWEAPDNRQPIRKKIKNTIQRMIARFIYRKADHCFTYGEKSKQYFINNGIMPDKISIVGNVSMMPVCICSDLREKLTIPHENKIILYFGRIIKKKGLDILIHAFHNLPIDIKEHCTIVVVGEGDYENDCKELAKNLGITNIHWCGYIHPDKRYQYFSQCDVFVLPTSHFEGSVEAWGLTINEAIQCGKAVVATSAVGCADELITSQNGRIAVEGSIGSLTIALMDVLDEDKMKNVENENKRIMDIFNYHKSADIFIRKFNEYLR
jgi:glycosyltransferase involved in cell wall biosynthesis